MDDICTSISVVLIVCKSISTAACLTASISALLTEHIKQPHFSSPSAARVLDFQGLPLLVADSGLLGASSLLSIPSPLISQVSGATSLQLTTSPIDHPAFGSANLTTLESFAHSYNHFAHLPTCSLLPSCRPLLHRRPRLFLSHSSARSSSHNTQMTLHPQLHSPHSHQLPQSCILQRTTSRTTSRTDQSTNAEALSRPPSHHSPAPTRPHQRPYLLPSAYGNGASAGTNLSPPSSVTMITGN